MGSARSRVIRSFSSREAAMTVEITRLDLSAAEQRAEVAKWVGEGPDFARDGVVRWRCVGPQARIERAFDVSLHERTVGRLLRTLSLRQCRCARSTRKASPRRKRL